MLESLPTPCSRRVLLGYACKARVDNFSCMQREKRRIVIGRQERSFGTHCRGKHRRLAWMSGVVAVAGVFGFSADSVLNDPYDSSQSRISLTGGPWMSSSRRWIVKTESNVKRERKKLPDPPCVICKGTGRVKCNRCCGRGRTNFKEQVMLPKGEWPKWCWDCNGSGMSYCTRCFGTGEKRGIIGFHMPDQKEGSQN